MALIEFEGQLINTMYITNIHFHQIHPSHWRLLIHFSSGEKEEFNYKTHNEKHVVTFLSEVKKAFEVCG